MTLVYCGHTVGWIRIPLGTEVGRGQGDIVFDGPNYPERGTTALVPHFSAHVYCGQTVAHFSNCWALVGIDGIWTREELIKCWKVRVVVRISALAARTRSSSRLIWKVKVNLGETSYVSGLRAMHGRPLHEHRSTLPVASILLSTVLTRLNVHFLFGNILSIFLAP